jgi:hypothetical protein
MDEVRARKILRDLLDEEKVLISEIQNANTKEDRIVALQNYSNKVNKFLMDLDGQKNNPLFKSVYSEAVRIRNWAAELKGEI